MRALILISAMALSGCTEDGGVVLSAANAASLMLVQRAVPDIVVSAISGRECSVVRLEQGKAYCRPPEPPPAPPPFCTRSLGRVECWANPEALGPTPHEVADGPRLLTPAQEEDRAKRWPGLW